MRGEVYMPWEIFAELVTQQDQNGEKPLKTRVRLALRQKTLRYQKRKLELFVLNLQLAEVTVNSYVNAGIDERLASTSFRFTKPSVRLKRLSAKSKE